MTPDVRRLSGLPGLSAGRYNAAVAGATVVEPRRAREGLRRGRVLSRLGEIFQNDPIKAVALVAALIALATTPIAFAVLGRMDWFKARRGRVDAAARVLVDLLRDGPGDGHPGDLRRAGHQERRLRQEPLRVRPEQDVVGPGAGPGLRLAQGGRRGRQGRGGAARAGSGRTSSTTSRSSTRRCWPSGPSPGTSPAVAQTIPDVLQRLAGRPPLGRARRPAAADGLHRPARRHPRPGRRWPTSCPG